MMIEYPGRMITSLFFLFGGLVFCIAGGKALVLSWMSRKWVKTVGTVIESQLKRQKDSPSKFIPLIRFSYKVDGKYYTGNRLWFITHIFYWHAHGSKIAEKYPAGKHVDVYYAEYDPNESVLNREPTGYEIGLVVCGVFVIFIGLMIFFNFHCSSQTPYGA